MKTISAALLTATVWAVAGLCAQDASSQSLYGQCGGTTYTGPTACPTGASCQYRNKWYSQCKTGGDSASGNNGGSSDGNDGGNNGGGSQQGSQGGYEPDQPLTSFAPQPSDSNTGGGDDNGDGGIVVTQTITTIYHVGSATLTSQVLVVKTLFESAVTSEA